MAAKIKASVGRKGKNLPDDVKTVQNLLNGFASKVKISKVKVDGFSSAALEKAIGVFQQEACGLRPDCRVDPGRATISKLVAGPAKLEAERKAKIADVEKHIEKERKRARDSLKLFVEKAVKNANLPYNIVHAIMLGLEAFLTTYFTHLRAGLGNFADAELIKITKKVDEIIKLLETQAKTLLSEAIRKRDAIRETIAKQRDLLLGIVAKRAVKQARANGLPVDAAEEIYEDIQAAVLERFDRLVDKRDDILDLTPKDVGDLGQKAIKEGENLIRTAISNALKVRAMILKTIATERNQALIRLRKLAETQAKKAGLPLKSIEMLYGKYEKIAKDQFEKFTENDAELFGIDAKDVTSFANRVINEVEGGVKAIANEAAKKRAGVKKNLMSQIKAQAKAMKLAANQVDEIIGDIDEFAEEQWDWLMGRNSGGDIADVGKMAGDVAKEAGSHMSDLLKEAEKRQREGESGEDAKTPILLRGSEEGIKQGGFSFKVSGKSPDPKSKVLLIVGKPGLQLDITKGFSKAQMVELFRLIDQGNLWSSTIDFYAIETTDGKPDKRTKSKTVSLRAPVAPFKGTVSLKGLGADKGMIYTGNGKGRYLYTTPINGWYFLKYGPNFERDPKMRGFDCITYVGSARKTMAGMSGRGDGLASHLGAKKVNMEGVSKEDIVEFFKGDGKSGTYIAWWKTHCISVVNGVVHEFSQSKGGFNTKAAASYGWPKTGNYARKL
ncbi:MAG: peptidoglycan-binding protein [Sulfitobacter sp.]|nr:peptidoglycan-binding protein [Sulfitobacter sp.]